MSGSDIEVIDSNFYNVWGTCIDMGLCQDCAVDNIYIENDEGSPTYGIHITDSSGIDITNSYIYGSYGGYALYSYNPDDFGTLDVIGEIFDYGVMVESSNTVLIYRCYLGGFDACIDISQSEEIAVIDSEISYCDRYGIVLNNSQLIEVSGCDVMNNNQEWYVSADFDTQGAIDDIYGSGIMINGSGYVWVEDGYITGFGCGVCISQSEEIAVIDSEIFECDYYGIIVNASQQVQVSGCDVTYYGEYWYEPSDLDILGISDEISGSGIIIEDSGYVRVEDSYIGEYDCGVCINQSDYVGVNNSSIYNCYSYGIILEDSQQATITWCDIRDSWDYNVYVSGDCTGSVLYRNIFRLGEGGDNVYLAGTGVTWNSPAPISYTYDDNAFTGYNGNYWYQYV
jgi:hypothetical protein